MSEVTKPAVRIWHDADAYARRSSPRPLADVRRDIPAFLQAVRELAEEYQIADVLCIAETNAEIDGKAGKGFSFAHHGDNARIEPMLDFVIGALIKHGLIDLGGDDE